MCLTHTEGILSTNSERLLRSDEAGHQLQSISGAQIVRQWRKFFNTVSNKNNLIAFLVNEWRKPEYRQKLKDQVLHATVNDKCFKISNEDRRFQLFNVSKWKQMVA